MDESRLRATLRWTSGTGQRHLVDLADVVGDGEVSIGRAKGCGIVIDDARASREHAIVSSVVGDEIDGTVWQVQDKRSSNGLWLYHSIRDVSKQRKIQLADGIRFMIGGTVITFEHLDPSADTDDEETRTRVPGRLTEAQENVLRALCRSAVRDPGSLATVSSLASEMHYSPNTIKTHIGDIYSAFGLDRVPSGAKRSMAVGYGLQLGYGE